MLDANRLLLQSTKKDAEGELTRAQDTIVVRGVTTDVARDLSKLDGEHKAGVAVVL
jgi:hypothetical protein